MAKHALRIEHPTIRGIPYRVYRWGEPDAPAVFLLHGWGDSGRTFELLVNDLLPDWQAIAPDWRGFGASGWAAGGYYFPDYLADLDQLLDHYSAHEPARLVGHSMGGNIAALYSGSRPERVAGLVSLEGFGLKDNDPLLAPERYGQWLAQLRSAPQPSTFTDFHALAARIRARHPTLSEELARFAARHWARRLGDRVVLRADPRHRRVNPVLYRRAEAQACWRAVQAPVLLLSGGESPFARGGHRDLDPDDGVRTFARVERVVIAGCGHMLHWEAPAEVAAQLEVFFMRLSEFAQR